MVSFSFHCHIVLIILYLSCFVHSQLPENMKPDHLAAWCIVPFDAKKRTPSERAQMLKRLGIQRSAYDWRGEHVKEFEEEILQYKKHGIEFLHFGPVMKKLMSFFKNMK